MEISALRIGLKFSKGNKVEKKIQKKNKKVILDK